MPNSLHADPVLEIQRADRYAQYLLHDVREIAFVLRQLAARRAMVTAHFGERNDFLLSSIVDVPADNKQILLDLGRDEEQIASALASNQLLCATQLNNIKIQFQLDGLARVSHEGLPALRAPLPQVLLRLQRREYYRVGIPATDDLLCHFQIDEKHHFSARILDISGGGLAIIAPKHGVLLEPGMSFKNCTLDLPGFSLLTFAVQIRNLFRVTQRNGQEYTRVGCQFVHLPMTTANTIQRYIMGIEQDRASRSKETT